MRLNESEAAAGRLYLRALRRVSAHIASLSRELLEPYNLTNQQAMALLAIRERDGLTQAALVKAIDSDANTVSGVVRRLEQRGLVTRSQLGNDARAAALSVTVDGNACADRAQQMVDRLALSVAATAPKRSRETISKWLAAVADMAAPTDA